MKINQLEYFVTAAKYNNITKAARKLYVSQPAISLAIKELEAEFNTKLFLRKNNILELTREGAHLVHLAKPLLSHHTKVQNDMLEFIKKNEVLHIGIPPMIGTFLLPRISRRFAKLHPNAQMEIKEYGSQANQLAVESGEINIALTVIQDDNKLPTLNYMDIGSTSLMLAVHKTSPLSTKKIITFQDLMNVPLILMNDETLQAQIVLNEFKKRGIKPNIRFRSNQIYTIKSLLSQNNIAAFAFDRIFENDDDIVLIPFDKEFKMNIVVCWRKDSSLDKLSSELIMYAKEDLAF